MNQSGDRPGSSASSCGKMPYQNLFPVVPTTGTEVGDVDVESQRRGGSLVTDPRIVE
jgi:hypothetical protein